jgi:peptidoglycan hydrolase-like protein with peptidoglycan-binding domain
MFSTFAAKFGALALTPFLVFGGHGQVAQSNNARVDTAQYAQAAVDTRANASASWKKEELTCTTIEHTLRLGSRDRNTDNEVTELQTFLRAEGYLRSQPSGFFGFATLRAVRSFQAAEGLKVTGVVQEETQTKIEAVSCDDDSDTELEITGITAPTSLMVDETGTWTVDVESETEGNLSYSVVWGDEGDARLMRMSTEDATQSSATFTHAYASAGTYTPEFTVTDSAGVTVMKASASVTVSTNAHVTISALTATAGYAGDSVTITGTNFTASSTVYVGSKVATSTATSDTSITFTVPSLGTGSYDVYVENENGTSNAIRFEIKVKETTRISISSINAPVRLSVDQEGTWTVNADTNATGNLRYSVVWGDEDMMRAMLGAQATTQTSSTFTHSYGSEGTYAPKFTISDGAGHSSSVSATVVVTQ